MPHTLDEKQLILAARSGDDAAFATLYESHLVHLRPVGMAILGTDDGLDDLTQDVFILAWKALPSFRGDSTFRTWLTTITKNHCCALRKRRKKAGEFPLLELPQSGDQHNPWAVSRSSELTEARLDLARLLMGLPPPSHEIVRRSLEGLSDRDIARETNQSLSAVRGRKQRAVDLMRKKIHKAAEQNTPPSSLMYSKENTREETARMIKTPNRKKRSKKSGPPSDAVEVSAGSVEVSKSSPSISGADLFDQVVAETLELERRALIERRREFEADLIRENENRVYAAVKKALADRDIDLQYEKAVLCRLTRALVADTTLREDCARLQLLPMGAYSRELRLRYVSGAAQHFLPGVVSELLAVIATKGGQ
jgi:RNA polymerase sigma-70 factor (ECF subfamily)